MKTLNSARPLVLAAVLAMGCGSAPNHAEVPAALMVPPEAASVRTEGRDDGQIIVSYTLVQPYPADGLLSQVRTALAAGDWTPLDGDWLNPGEPATPRSGWFDYIDGASGQDRWVHQLNVQWKNTSGDVVWYQLQYHSDPPSALAHESRPDNPDLHVTRFWIPAATADQLRRRSQSARR